MMSADLFSSFEGASAGAITLWIVLLVWTLVWKGLALWRAARNKHKIWFVVILIINTLGVLEILYYFIWGKPKGLWKKIKDKIS